MKKFLLFILLASAFSSMLMAQESSIESITTPLILSQCGPVEDSLYFKVTNDGDSLLTGVTAELSFLNAAGNPLSMGIEQLAVVSDDPAVMYSGTGDEITLPDLMPGEMVEFYIAVRANCSFLPKLGGDAGFDLDVSYTVGTAPGTESIVFDGEDLFNVQRPDLSIPVVTPSSIDAFLGKQDSVMARVTNAGNGSLDSLYYCVENHPNVTFSAIKVGDVTLTEVSLGLSGQRCFLITGAAIAEQYPLDSILPGGSNLEVQECFTITSCDLEAPDLRRQAFFGCEGTLKCDDNRDFDDFFSVGLSFGTALPDLRIVFKEDNRPACFNDANLFTEFYIINDGDDAFGPARDIIFSATDFNNQFFSATRSITHLGTMAAVENAIEDPSMGTSGCESGELIGYTDTIFDANLAIGDTLLVRQEYFYKCDCYTNCTQIRDIYRSRYNLLAAINPCELFAGYTNNRFDRGTFDAFLESAADGPLDLSSGQKGTINYQIYSSQLDWLSGSNYPDAYLELQFYIPDGFDYSSGTVSFTDIDGTVYPIDYLYYNDNQDVGGTTADTLLVRFASPLPSGFSVGTGMNLTYCLNADCTEKETPPDCGNPAFNELISTAGFFTTDPNCNNCPIFQIFCPEDLEIRLFCPDNGCDDCEGIVFTDFDISRTNFGEPDADNNQNRDGIFADVDSLVNRKRFLPGDSLRATYQGRINDVSPDDDWEYGFAKLFFEHEEFTPLGATVFIRDADGSDYTCTVVPITKDLSDSSLIVDFSIATLNSLGCAVPATFVFADDDSISVTLDYVSKRAITSEEINNIFYNTAFYVSDAPYNMGARFQCNDRRERLQLIGFTSGQNRADNNIGGCTIHGNGDLNLQYEYYYGFIDNDEFPYEIRPFGIPKELFFVKPSEFNFRLDQVQARFRNETGADENLIGGGSNSTFIIPPAYLSEQGDTLVFFAEAYINDLGIADRILPDEGFEVTFYPKIQGNCMTEIRNYNTAFGGTLSVDENVFCTSEIELPGEVRINAFRYTQAALLTVVATPQNVLLCEATQEVMLRVVNSSNGNADFAFFYAESPTGNLVVTRVEDALTGMAIPVNSFGIYELGSIRGGRERRLRAFVRANACNTERLDFVAGWDCAAYPTTIEEATCSDPSVVVFNSTPSGINLDVLSPTSNQRVDLCDTVSYEFQVVSTNLGYLREVIVRSVLPPHQEYVPGTYEFSWPSSAILNSDTNYMPAPAEPIMLADGLQFNVFELEETFATQGLVGSKNIDSNRVSIRFKTIIDCGFSSGSRARFSASSRNNCGDPLPVVNKGAPRVRVVDPKANFRVDIGLSNTVLNACGPDTITANFDMRLTSGTVSDLDSALVTLPRGLCFVESSYLALVNNGPGARIDTNSNGEQIFVVPLSGSLSTGESVSFQIDVHSKDIGQLCEQYPITAAIFSIDTSRCLGEVCDIRSQSGQASRNITLVKPDVNFTYIDGMLTIEGDGTETLSLTTEICNYGNALSAGIPMVFDIYEDNDNNGERSAGDTYIISYDTLFTGDLENGDCFETTIILNLSPGVACNLIAVLNPDSTCTCFEQVSNIEIPEYVFEYDPDTTICSNDNVSIGLPAISGFMYQWLPIGGASPTFISPDDESMTTFSVANSTDNPQTYRYRLRSSRDMCYAYDTFNITVLPDINETFNLTACIDRPYNLPVSDIEGTNFVWSPMAGLTIDPMDPRIAIVDNVMSGNTSYTLTYESLEGNCPVSLTYNVGGVDCAGNAALGDTVFWDQNKDGLQTAGEPGIAGVQVNLINANTGAVVSTKFTNANGFYLFDSLPPGNYAIEFVQPTHFTYTTDNVGINDSLDSDADPVDGRTDPVLLGINQVIPTLDAGFVATCDLDVSLMVSSCFEDGNEAKRRATIKLSWADNPYMLAQFGGFDTINISFEGIDTFVRTTTVNGMTTLTLDFVPPLGRDSVMVTAGFVFQDDCNVISDSVAAPSCIYDVALKKEIANMGLFAVGDTVMYNIIVENQASAVKNIVVNDYVPSGLRFEPDLNPGWLILSSTLVRNTITDTLQMGEQDTLSLKLIIEPSTNENIDYLNIAEIARFQDLNSTNVTNLDIDSEADNNPNNDRGGQPNSAADNELDGNGTGTIGDGVAATDEDDQDPALIFVPQRFDLALFKVIDETATPAPYLPGDTVAFQIFVLNQGTLGADSIAVTDSIPEGMTYIDGTNGVIVTSLGLLASVNELGNGRFGVDTLAPDDTLAISVRARINPDFMEGELVNAAEISFASNPRDSVDIDSDPDDNPFNDPGDGPGTDDDNETDENGQNGMDEDDSDPALVRVTQIFDLALIKQLNNSLSTPPFDPGDTLTYDITVYNQGTISADSATVSDYIPEGMSYVDGTNAAVLSELGNTIQVTELGNGEFGIDTIPLMDTFGIQIRLRIDPDFMGTSLTNVAEISFASNPFDSLDIDSELNRDSTDNGGGAAGTPSDNSIGGNGQGAPGNTNANADEDNSDPALVFIRQMFDLALIKQIDSTATPPPYAPGDSIEFKITIYNQGTLSADSLAVCDSLPEGLSYVSGSSGAVSTTLSNTVNVNNLNDGTFGLDTLAAGDTLCISVRAAIDLNYMGVSGANFAEICFASNVLDSMDIDSDPDNNFSNDIGGEPGGATDNEANDDGTLDEDDHDPALILFKQTFDLALTKVVDITSTPPPYDPGDTVAFSVRVINQGTLNADSLTVTDYIPYGMSYVSGDDGNLTTFGGSTIVADALGGGVFGFDTLRARDSFDFSIRLRIDSLFMGDTLVNVAEISYAENALDSLDIDSDLNDDDTDNGGGQPNSDADNATNGNGDGAVGDGDDETDEDNSDPAFLFVRQVFDLALIKQLDTTIYKLPFQQGDTIAFKYTLFNQGTLTADTISVIDYIPTDLNFQRATNGVVNSAFGNPTQVTDLGGGEVGVDSLFRGDTLCFNMVFEIDSFFMGTSFTNFAEISYAENALDSMDVDSDPDNMNDNDSGGDPFNDNDKTDENGKMGGDEDDHDPEFILVVQSFDLALTKLIDSTMNPGPYFPGDTVPFTITVFNQGRLSADSVEVTDYIPFGLSYVDIPAVTVNSTVRNTPINIAPLAGSPGVYTLDTLPVRDRVSFTIKLRIDDAGLVDTAINYAEISYATNLLDSLDADSRPDNNQTNDPGGAPETEADNSIFGDGLNGGGMPGDTLALTDEDDHDPALIVITRDKLNALVLLGGALGDCKAPSEFMSDSLRSKGLIPLREPYSDLPGFTHVGMLGGTEMIDPLDSAALFADLGSRSIVDWVFVELRDANDRTRVLNTRSAFLLADGNIVELDGVGPLCFDSTIVTDNDSFYVAVRHRNHLGVMTQNRVNLNNTYTNPVDFSDTQTAIWNSMPQFDGNEQNTVSINAMDRYALWQGNANGDGRVVLNSDRAAIQSRIFNNPLNSRNNRNFIVPGYLLEDVNMDGRVIMTGRNNDVDAMLNAIYNHPLNAVDCDVNFEIEEQLPRP